MHSFLYFKIQVKKLIIQYFFGIFGLGQIYMKDVCKLFMKYSASTEQRVDKNSKKK